MSKKKHKKRHSQDVMDAKRRANQEKLADERARAKNRMNPVARGLLFGNLIFLAAAQLLYSSGIISDTVSSICTILGVILLLAALWFQFGNKKDGGDMSGGNWPGLH